MLSVCLFGMMYKIECPTGVAESGFYLCLNRVEPGDHLGVGAAAASERACRPNPFAGFLGARSITRKCWSKGHMRKRGRAEKCIAALVCGLEREHETWLRQFWLLEVEELQSPS